MQILEAILNRRSIRRFSVFKKVEKNKIELLLKAAMSAPSAGNSQPWAFVVIDDESTLREVPSIHPYGAMFSQAPLGIAVCADPSREKHKGYWPQDCAAAVQNILLATQDLGLEAVWCGLYPNENAEKQIKELLKIPENIHAFALVAIGYSDAKGHSVDRYDAAKVHKNRWDGK
ncbi:nitroreductase family protein [Geovibrio sp. ADMFC3]